MPVPLSDELTAFVPELKYVKANGTKFTENERVCVMHKLADAQDAAEFDLENTHLSICVMSEANTANMTTYDKETGAAKDAASGGVTLSQMADEFGCDDSKYPTENGFPQVFLDTYELYEDTAKGDNHTLFSPALYEFDGGHGLDEKVCLNDACYGICFNIEPGRLSRQGQKVKVVVDATGSLPLQTSANALSEVVSEDRRIMFLPFKNAGDKFRTSVGAFEVEASNTASPPSPAPDIVRFNDNDWVYIVLLIVFIGFPLIGLFGFFVYRICKPGMLIVSGRYTPVASSDQPQAPAATPNTPRAMHAPAATWHSTRVHARRAGYQLLV